MNLRKIGAIFLSLIMVFSLCITTVLADETTEEANHEHATTSGATVSEELDKATNKDDTMETQIYIYCPPDPHVEDTPLMGDTGIKTNSLLIAAFFVGLAYVVTASYAYRDDDRGNGLCRKSVN